MEPANNREHGETNPSRPAGRILAIDDEAPNLVVITAALSPLGYEVRTAAGTVEADELTTTWHPDLVLLDVMMPGESGIEACRRLRCDARFAATPIILLTALGADHYRSQGLDAGADDYIEKPFDFETITMRVASWLATGRRRRSHAARFRGPDSPAGRVLAAAAELTTPQAAPELAAAMARAAGIDGRTGRLATPGSSR